MREHLRGLASIAAEARLLSTLRRDQKIPASFFQTHADALADRAAEHLAELTSRETTAALLSKQAEAIDYARELTDALRPLTGHSEAADSASFRQLEQVFEQMDHAL